MRFDEHAGVQASRAVRQLIDDRHLSIGIADAGVPPPGAAVGAPGPRAAIGLTRRSSISTNLLRFSLIQEFPGSS
jgi:hypothetical protein